MSLLWDDRIDGLKLAVALAALAYLAWHCRRLCLWLRRKLVRRAGGSRSAAASLPPRVVAGRAVSCRAGLDARPCAGRKVIGQRKQS